MYLDDLFSGNWNGTSVCLTHPTGRNENQYNVNVTGFFLKRDY